MESLNCLIFAQADRIKNISVEFLSMNQWLQWAII